MKRVAVALVLALGFACSSSEEAAPGATGPAGPAADADASAGEPSAGSARSGSRLKIVRFQAPGGVFAQPALRDTQLGSCSPMQTEDGLVRCVPDDRATVGAAFADAACTTPLAVTDGACPAHHAVMPDAVPATAAACELGATQRVRVFTIGAEQAAATVYQQSNGGCAATPVPAGTKVFAATELAPTEMVALTKKDEPIGRVAVRMMTSDDGLRLPLGLVDAASANACSLVRASDGQDPLAGEATTVACVPGAPAVAAKAAPLFTDGTCTEPAAGFLDMCGRPPSYVEVRDGSDAPGCAGKKELHALGAQVPAAFSGTPDACSPIDMGSGGVQSYWSAGDPLALAPLATAERTLDGTDRLRAVAYAVDGKKVLDGFAPGFVDGDGGCVAVGIDGSTYCLPVAITVVPPNGAGVFADAACTKPVVTSGSACHQKPRFAIAATTPFTCDGSPSATHLYEIGNPPAALYANVNGACQPSNALPGLDTYELGAERKAADVLVRLDATEL